MPLLSKSDILAPEDMPYEDVDVPEWGGSVRVRVMTGMEKDDWEASIYRMKSDGVELNQENFRASLISRTLCDENGPIEFSPTEIIALGAKSSLALDRVFKAARRINRISKEDQEELTKN